MNIKDIKKGDEIQICGGDYHKVSRVTRITSRGSVFIDLSNTHGFQVPIELITDHRPAFNWDDAKSGMCFMDNWSNCLVWFVGHDFEDGQHIVYATSEECTEFGTRAKTNLTRHPDGDIT